MPCLRTVFFTARVAVVGDTYQPRVMGRNRKTHGNVIGAFITEFEAVQPWVLGQ
jgi:hypothetical protein